MAALVALAMLRVLEAVFVDKKVHSPSKADPKRADEHKRENRRVLKPSPEAPLIATAASVDPVTEVSFFSDWLKISIDKIY